MRSTNRTLGAEALCIVSPDPEPSLLEAGQQVKLITTNVGFSYGAAVGIRANHQLCGAWPGLALTLNEFVDRSWIGVEE